MSRRKRPASSTTWRIPSAELHRWLGKTNMWKINHCNNHMVWSVKVNVMNASSCSFARLQPAWLLCNCLHNSDAPLLTLTCQQAQYLRTTPRMISHYMWYIYIYMYECVNKLGMLFFSQDIDWSGHQLSLGPASFDTIIVSYCWPSKTSDPTSPPTMMVWLSS